MKLIVIVAIGALAAGCRTAPNLDKHLSHAGDRFNAAVLSIEGTPAGGELMLHDRGNRSAPVRVNTSVGQTTEQIAEELAAALSATVVPRAVRLPFAYRDHNQLIFYNVALGDVYVTSTDSGLVTLPPVTNPRAVRTSDRVALQWNAVSRATGYAIFRNGLPIGRVEQRTDYTDTLPSSIHGNPAWHYEVIAHRDGEIVSPPAVVVISP